MFTYSLLTGITSYTKGSYTSKQRSLAMSIFPERHNDATTSNVRRHFALSMSALLLRGIINEGNALTITSRCPTWQPLSTVATQTKAAKVNCGTIYSTVLTRHSEDHRD